MTRDQLACLSHADLRDKLKARAEDRSLVDDLEPQEVLAHLMSLPINVHTADSGDGLLYLSTYSFLGPERGALIGALAARIATAVTIAFYFQALRRGYVSSAAWTSLPAAVTRDKPGCGRREQQRLS